MPRYKLILEYDGTPYAGWQHQATHRSVQQAIEEAILAFSGETIRIRAAGRTDAGVHASHQVVDLDLTRDWKSDTVRDAINAYLKPEPIAILLAECVAPDFSARMNAIKRHYRYRILNRRPHLSAIGSGILSGRLMLTPCITRPKTCSASMTSPLFGRRNVKPAGPSAP